MIKLIRLALRHLLGIETRDKINKDALFGAYIDGVRDLVGSHCDYGDMYTASLRYRGFDDQDLPGIGDLINPRSLKELKTFLTELRFLDYLSVWPLPLDADDWCAGPDIKVVSRTDQFNNAIDDIMEDIILIEILISDGDLTAGALSQVLNCEYIFNKDCGGERILSKYMC